ncbi:hypothetical protein BBK36DRAFT_1176206, partial [Trichoderma citrinoviride]
MDRHPPGYSLPPYDDELDSPTGHGAAAVRLLTSVEEPVDRDRPYVTQPSPLATPAFLNTMSSPSVSMLSLHPKEASKHQGPDREPEASTMAFDECPAAASSLETRQEPEMQAATTADDSLPPPLPHPSSSSPSVLHRPLPKLDVVIPPPLYIKQLRPTITAKLHSPASSALSGSPNLAEALPTIPEGP